MGELLTALGLMFVIEGATYALFPEAMKRMVSQLLALQTNQIRMFGLAFAIFGFLIIAVLRGL